jgi:hypothetical protein
MQTSFLAKEHLAVREVTQSKGGVWRYLFSTKVFWDVFPSLYSMQTFLFTLNEQELTIVKNLLISTSLVAKQSIGH